MDCPKCKSTMEKVEYQSIEVDRCTGCKGLWFDLMELESLEALAGSEQIDIGNPEVGRKYNDVGKIICPTCHSPMVRMVDLEQPHIWFEKCSGCSGSFFDAGEFKDLKEENLIDFIKDLFAKTRN